MRENRSPMSRHIVADVSTHHTEATAGIEPAMKVLQTSALPLGYVADEKRAAVHPLKTTPLVRKSNDSRALTLF